MSISRYDLDSELVRSLRLPPVPDSWREVHNRLNAAFGEVVLAGGALRDLILNRPVKDLDFVLAAREPDEVEDLLCHMAYFSSLHRMGSADADLKTYALNLPGILGVWEVRMESLILDLPIQLIMVSPLPAEMVPPVPAQVSTLAWHAARRADFGICQLAYDGKAMILTHEFIEDAQNRRFVLRNLKDAETSLVRYYRLQQKYPGWAFEDVQPGKPGLVQLLESGGGADAVREALLQNRTVPQDTANTYWIPSKPDEPSSWWNATEGRWEVGAQPLPPLDRGF